MSRVVVLGLVVGLMAGCGDDDGPGDASTGTDSGTDSGGTDSGMDSGMDSGVDSGTDAAVDTGTDAATDSGADATADAGTGMCTTNRECDPNYCNAATCDGPGACEVRPAICSRILDPVCGCDDMDYSNPCLAAQAGVRVASRGTCAADCIMGARAGCCFDDGDCNRRGTECRGATCVVGGAGTCVATPGAGECWDSLDCAPGAICDGARQCPCGALCILPDQVGSCVSRSM